MLVDFTLKNFASFRDEKVLSAEVGSRLRKFKTSNTFSKVGEPLLKNLLIFGPNGAGKTQIIDGLLFMRNLVMQGGSPAVSAEIPYNPFMLDEKSKERDTEFAVRLMINRQEYRYSFAYNSKQVSHEKLEIKRKNQFENYFVRNGQQLLVAPDSLKNVEQNIRKNGLFIYVAQQLNDSVAGTVYSWFVDDLININSNGEISRELVVLMKKPELKNEMLAFLRRADFNISDIKVEEVQGPNVSEIPDALQQVLKLTNRSLPKTILQLVIYHKEYDEKGNVVGEVPFTLNQESLGTGRLFKIMLHIIYAQITGNRKTILIDEFDDSLHSELSKTLIKIFNTEENMNQFIVTTHNLELMDQQLRVDQIYLVEKDFHGISDINSIFDFDDSRRGGRLDISFAKRYVEGRYGAVPMIDSQKLINVLAKVNKLGGK